jgi:hypothetical protein
MAMTNKDPISRRSFVHFAALGFSTLALPACGGGGGDAPIDTGSIPGSQKSLAAPTLAPPAPAPVVTRLNVTSTADGMRPFAASVFPLEGQVPAGKTLASPDDATLACSVLSHWGDGSAAVMVASGNTAAAKGTTATLALQLADGGAAPAALTAARVGQLVSNIKADFGVLGTAQLSDLSVPERVWWVNAQVICARYRLRAPGHATLEAIVDIHAYASNFAFVEMVVENGRVDTVLPQPVRPADADYVGTLYVNGAAIGSGKSADAPELTHSAFRAWYAAGWVGDDPGLFACQAVADLQKHPLLFRMDQAAGDVSGYASDIYLPWGAGRHRGQAMGGAGDHPSIGPLTQWDAAFLQSGSRAAAAAVEVSALSVLSFNLVYRDEHSGLIPDQAMLVGRQRGANFPGTYNPDSIRDWEVAHHPAVGLIAFAARPSPVHLETAQRIVMWNATWSAGGTGSSNLAAYKGNDFATDSTGVYGFYYQPRGRAWCLRSLVHATFLSPDGSTWREGGRRWLDMNRAYLAEWMKGKNSRALGFMLGNGPVETEPLGPNGTHRWPTWQTHFMIPELHKAASAKLLSGSQQAALEALADWAAAFPVRWINEQPNGGWRYIPYQQKFTSDETGTPPATWGKVLATINATSPPSVAGPWFTSDWETVEYAAFFGDAMAGGTAGYYYVSVFWAALVAATERGIPGSSAAWSTVQNNVTNLSYWRQGFADNARFGATPRTVGGQAL